MVVNKVSNGYRWLMLAIMGMGTMVAGQMLWLFYGYYDLIQAYFGVTNTQMGYIGTMTGLIMIVNWPVGGMIADRLSMRTSCTVCMIWSFVVYSFFAFNKSFAMYMIVMALSSVIVGMFYGLFAKVVKGVSTEKTEGKNSGWLWSLYALASSILGASGSYFVAKMDLAGWKPLMFMFAGVALITLVLGLIFIRDDKFNDWSVMDAGSAPSKFSFSQVGVVLKMPEVWVASFIYFTMLMITCAGVYAISMMGAIYAVPLAVITLMGTFRAYMARVFLSPFSGYLIDKFKSSMKVIRMFLILNIVSFALFLVFPMTSDYLWVSILLVIATIIGFGMQAPCWVTPITEIRVPVAYHGTAIGIYNGVGCISDAFIYILCGHFVDTYGLYEGNRYVFMFIGVMLIICFVLTKILDRFIAKRKLADQQ